MLSYLISGFRGGSIDFMTVVIDIAVSLLVIFLIMPFHEWAHAFTAYRLGDKGIKERGRLSLNPLSHIDPIGALLIIFVGFGWAKPVSIDPRNFKNPKVGMGISALAGPVANFLAALVGGLIFNALFFFFPEFMYLNQIGQYISMFFAYYIMLNIVLAVFNLVPIPPLDGSKILFMFLPDKWVYTLYKYENFFFIIILALVWFNLLPLGPIEDALMNFVMWLTELPFVPFM
jgi:Zn-dependent protease